jgi:hypothetical protein
LHIVFTTDSKTIAARWTTSDRIPGTNMTPNTQKGLDLYIMRNGEWVFAGVGSPKISGTRDTHEHTIVTNMAEGEKLCLLYLPIFDSVEKLEIGVEQGSNIAATENPFRHKIVVHGSSITHGASSSRAGMTYPAIFSRHTGLYTCNLGYSGRCKLQPEFATFLAEVADADAFVFDTFSNPSAEVIVENFDRFVDIIREKHPTTPLIFTQTIRRDTRNFNLKTEDFEAKKQAAAERVVRLAEEKFAGNPGQVLFVLRDHNDGDNSRFIPIDTSSDGDWQRLHSQAESDLVVAHSWFRSLSGLDYSTGFSADRIIHEYEVALNTVILPEQARILEPIRHAISTVLGVDASSLDIINQPPTRSKPLYMRVWEARKADGLTYDENDPDQQLYLAQITKYNLQNIG